MALYWTVSKGTTFCAAKMCTPGFLIDPPAVIPSDEEFHGTTPLVGSLNFFHFGTEQLGSVLWELRNNFV